LSYKSFGEQLESIRHIVAHDGFEKVYQIDPSRESIEEIESRSIELSDQQVLHRIGESLLGKKLDPTTLEPDPNEPILVYEETIILSRPDEKNTSEVTKKKPAKNNRKSNKAAVESVQEKL
jgi:hypothetical protein